MKINPRKTTKTTCFLQIYEQTGLPLHTRHQMKPQTQRKSHTLSQQATNTALSQNTFSCRIIKEWNGLLEIFFENIRTEYILESTAKSFSF